MNICITHVFVRIWHERCSRKLVRERCFAYISKAQRWSRPLLLTCKAFDKPVHWHAVLDTGGLKGNRTGNDLLYRCICHASPRGTESPHYFKGLLFRILLLFCTSVSSIIRFIEEYYYQGSRDVSGFRHRLFSLARP
jgi:hypothetical protein